MLRISRSLATAATAALWMLWGCAGPSEEAETAAPQDEATEVASPQETGGSQENRGFQLTSNAFVEGEAIPVQHTCDSANRSPMIKWTNAPEGTRSFALICDDPDAPTGTFVHWVLFNIPPETRELPAGLPQSDTLASGMRQGINDFREIGYGGPCPPRDTTHRYFFKLYALDTQFERIPGASKGHLEEAMQGHVLAQTELMGRYTRAAR